MYSVIIYGFVGVAWIASLVLVHNRAVRKCSGSPEVLSELLKKQPDRAQVFAFRNSKDVRAALENVRGAILTNIWPPRTWSGWGAWTYNLRYIVFPRSRPRDFA
jgi:hypothetical protein